MSKTAAMTPERLAEIERKCGGIAHFERELIAAVRLAWTERDAARRVVEAASLRHRVMWRPATLGTGAPSLNEANDALDNAVAELEARP